MSRTVITNRAPRQTVVYPRSGMGARGPAGEYPIAMSIRGTLVAGIGVIPYPMVKDATIVRITAAVGTAPTGASIIFDIKKNGVSIFTLVVLSIAAGQTVSVPVVPEDTNLSAGDKLTVDVVQIGSTIAGANATIVIDVV